MKMPKTIGTCVDHLFKLEQEKKALNKAFQAKEKEIKSKIAIYNDHLLTEFGKSRLDGAIGKNAKVKVMEKDVPTVKDWGQLYAFIVKNDAFDLLQKRVSAPAWSEREDDGIHVPGVETFKKVTLSITKA